MILFGSMTDMGRSWDCMTGSVLLLHSSGF